MSKDREPGFLKDGSILRTEKVWLQETLNPSTPTRDIESHDYRIKQRIMPTAAEIKTRMFFLQCKKKSYFCIFLDICYIIKNSRDRKNPIFFLRHGRHRHRRHRPDIDRSATLAAMDRRW